MALLSIDGLSISFGGVQALSDIGLELQPQEILAVIGPNGSGKTTLFNCISAVYRPQSGSIIFNGESLLRLSPDRVARKGVARTFQNLRLFMQMTVLDNLLLGRHLQFRKNPLHALFRLRAEELRHREPVEELVDFLQLEPYRQMRIGDCPYGVQKRAELGRALAMQPRLLMLDEPFSGLTAEEKQQTAYLINEIRGRFKPSILLVEHDLRLASALADSMVALVSGRIVAAGKPEEVLKEPEVVRAYIGEDTKDTDGKRHSEPAMDAARIESAAKPAAPAEATPDATAVSLGSASPAGEPAEATEPAPATALLRLSNIETLYFDRICVLRGLSLELSAGKIFTVVGPNGAGKTTLLKSIAGLLRDQPKKGTIEFFGKRIERRPPEEVAELGVVYVPEDRGLFRELSVRENLDLGCWGRPRGRTHEDLQFVYQLFPMLKEKASVQAENLSGGQQQMLALGRAWLRRPRLLMIDEPSLGLAPLVAREVYAALLEISRGGTGILLAEQNATLALKIAEYGYIMEGGRIVLEGTPSELRKNRDVQELYLGIGRSEGEDRQWRLYKKKRTW